MAKYNGVSPIVRGVPTLRSTGGTRAPAVGAGEAAVAGGGASTRADVAGAPAAVGAAGAPLAHAIDRMAIDRATADSSADVARALGRTGPLPADLERR